MGELIGWTAVILIFGGIPGLLVVAYYHARMAKHKERLALIEKGMDPGINMKEEPPYYNALMWGMLVVGIGLGALVGYIFSVYTPMDRAIMMPTLAAIFGGLGLIGFFIYRKKTGTAATA